MGWALGRGFSQLIVWAVGFTFNSNVKAPFSPTSIPSPKCVYFFYNTSCCQILQKQEMQIFIPEINSFIAKHLDPTPQIHISFSFAL